MEKEQIAVVKGLMNASQKCANTYMRAIDTLKAEKMNTSKITKAVNFPLIFVQRESTNA